MRRRQIMPPHYNNTIGRVLHSILVPSPFTFRLGIGLCQTPEAKSKRSSWTIRTSGTYWTSLPQNVDILDIMDMLDIIFTPFWTSWTSFWTIWTYWTFPKSQLRQSHAIRWNHLRLLGSN